MDYLIVAKLLRVRQPRSQTSVTLPPNTKQKGEKLDLVPNCFLPLQGFIVHCLWQRVSLFSEAPVEEVSGRLEDMWLLWMNEPAWVTGWGTGGLQRIDIVYCFLCHWEVVSVIHTSKGPSECHLTELVSIAREQNVQCNWSHVLDLMPPECCYQFVHTWDKQQWPLVP